MQAIKKLFICVTINKSSLVMNIIFLLCLSLHVHAEHEINVPNIYPESSTYISSPGSTWTISCKYRSTKSEIGSIQWITEKVSSTLESRITIEHDYDELNDLYHSVLTLRSVEYLDTGPYTCLAGGKSTTVYLWVFQKWSGYNGQSFIPTLTYHIEEGLIIANGSLNYHNGQIKCQASREGTIKDLLIILFFKELPEVLPPPAIQLRTPRPIEGENEKQTTKNFKEPGLVDHTVIYRTLTILNVDITDSGMYTCQLTAAEGSVLVSSPQTRFNLKIYEQDQYRYISDPIFRGDSKIIINDKKFYEKEIRWIFDIEAYPNPEYSLITPNGDEFFFNSDKDKYVFESSDDNKRKKLVINNPSLSDTGAYLFIIRVKDSVLPSLEKSIDDYIYEENHHRYQYKFKAELHNVIAEDDGYYGCSICSLPSNLPHQNQEPICRSKMMDFLRADSIHGHTILSNNTPHNIKEVKVEDELIRGDEVNYFLTCLASTKEFQNHTLEITSVVLLGKIVRIFLYEKAVIKIVPSISPTKSPHNTMNATKISLEASGVFVLNCDAQGRPIPEVKWMKDGTPFDVESDETVDFGSSNFILFFKGRYADKNKKLSAQQVHELIKGHPESMNPDMDIQEQAHLLPYNKDEFEFPRDRLKIGKLLGSGEFGYVKLAQAIGLIPGESITTVAVKSVKPNSDDSYFQILVGELKIMTYLGKHLNIVNLLGAVTSDPLITCNVSISNKSFRRSMVSIGNALKTEDLLDWAMQITNVLQSLSKWLSIESLKYGTFTRRSDIWSFGVVLWEMFTLGRLPYPNMEYGNLLPFLESGKRMEQPMYCPDSIYYRIMRICWSENPSERPSWIAMRDTFEFMVSNKRDMEELATTEEIRHPNLDELLTNIETNGVYR
ncbi:FLT1 [Lepeophtheirus salmonis]|uniref:receptor protein-tyrosine kinase n=1 Tax=Lepeophtheirus salmonis TaxID=72036 RepID=A0A7R8H9V2_LEPSM|nr:FLT1 [Lepeophtheirus salmonis]CAF2966904.1 FLT1 [Lepeophtheirus salmonis]